MSHDERPPDTDAERGGDTPPDTPPGPAWQTPTNPPPPGPGWQPDPAQGSPPSWSPAPPQAQGWTPPPSTWSQPPGWGPPQGPPGWAGSGHWAPPPEYGSSVLAVIGGVVLLVIGLLVSLISALVLAIGAGGASFLETIDPSLPAGAIAGFLIVVFGIMLVIGILHVIAAIGVFVHRSWARWLGIVLAVLGLLIGALMLLGVSGEAGTAPTDMVIVLIWLAAYGFSVLALAAGGEHFRRRYAPS